MKTTLRIDRMKVHARHGVLPQENVVGAWFYVSLEAEIQCSPEAYRHDELEGTVSYADIAACIAQEMATPSKLLENLVYRLGQALLLEFPKIDTLSLFVAKENPPMKAQCDEIGIKMEFSRQ